MILCSGVNTVERKLRLGGTGQSRPYVSLLDPDVLKDVAAAFAGTAPALPARMLKPAERPGGAYFELIEY